MYRLSERSEAAPEAPQMLRRECYCAGWAHRAVTIDRDGGVAVELGDPPWPVGAERERGGREGVGPRQARSDHGDSQEIAGRSTAASVPDVRAALAGTRRRHGAGDDVDRGDGRARPAGIGQSDVPRPIP